MNQLFLLNFSVHVKSLSGPCPKHAVSLSPSEANWRLAPSTYDFITTSCRHQMETFSALLALCEGNSRDTGEFPSQRPVTRSFDVFFDLHLNKRLSKKSGGWCFQTPSHYDVTVMMMKFDGWPWKTIGHLFYATSSFAPHFVAIGEFKGSYSLEMPNLGQIRRFFFSRVTLRITLKKQ